MCRNAVSSFLVLALLPAGVVAQASGRKVPRPLPVTQDVKTPEPPRLGGPGLFATPAAHGDRPGAGGGSLGAAPIRRDPAHAIAPGPRVIDHVESSVTGQGTVWARGRTYKASFESEGTTFVPFFGAQAPANHPVLFTTRSISVGSTQLACGPASPVLDSDAVTWVHEGFVERWQLRLDGLEQQFVLDSLPASGDLLVTIETHTDLVAACGNGGIAFSGDLGRVEYGAATVVDAHGRRFGMTSTLAGDAIVLRLAQHDLEQAAWPITVDPFVSTFPLQSLGTQDYLPDVAYDAASDRYLIVYEETYSGTDHDIYSELRDASGALVQGAYVDYTTEYWSTPRVANNALSANFMCVAAVGAPGNLRIIRGRTVDDAGAMGNPFTIAGADAYDKAAPDVGGDPALVGPTYYLVAWERYYTGTDHDVHARLVDADGTLEGTGPIYVDNSGATYDSLPDVSKSDGNPPFATQEWTIVWQRFSNQWNQYQIFGSQVHWDGAITHPTYAIDATSDDDLNPRVSSLLDGDGVTRPYMVAIQDRSQGGDWDITGAVFIGTAFQVGTNIPNYVDLATLPRDQVLPSIDSDGRHFAVAYSEHSPIGTENYDVLVADLVYAGNYPYVCESAVLASTLTPELDTSITSTYSSGGARRRYLVAWEGVDLHVGTEYVDAAVYDGCEGGFAKAFCFGDGTATACPCGNVGALGNGCANSTNPGGANLDWSGNPTVSADTFVLAASGMPPGGVGLYFQGQPHAGSYYGSVFGDGIRCIAASVVRIGPKLGPTGASQYPEAGDTPISIKGAIPAAGGQTFYQMWYRNADTFCTTSPFNLTNGLSVVWAP